MTLFRNLALSAVLGATILAGSPTGLVAQGVRAVPVVVENHGFLDMHVYAVQSGIRRSLGLATGLSTRRFELPRGFVESNRDLQLVAEPIGSRSFFVSEVLFVDPGEQLHLKLENHLGLSTTTVMEQPTSKDES